MTSSCASAGGPASSQTQARRALLRLRSRRHRPSGGAARLGADFLLIPGSELCGSTKTRLRAAFTQRYRLIVDEAAAMLFALRAHPSTEATVWADLRRAIARWGELGRDPVILDWHTGLDLRAQFPDVRIFLLEDGPSLPYIDETIDVVALPASATPAEIREARRVAGLAIVSLPSVRRDHHSKSNPRAMLRTARGSRSSSRASSSRRPWWRQRSRHCGPRSTGPMPRSSWFATHPLSSPDPRLGNGRTRTIVYGCSRHQTERRSPLHATRPHRPRRARSSSSSPGRVTAG